MHALGSSQQRTTPHCHPQRRQQCSCQRQQQRVRWRNSTQACRAAAAPATAQLSSESSTQQQPQLQPALLYDFHDQLIPYDQVRRRHLVSRACSVLNSSSSCTCQMCFCCTYHHHHPAHLTPHLLTGVGVAEAASDRAVLSRHTGRQGHGVFAAGGASVVCDACAVWHV